MKTLLLTVLAEVIAGAVAAAQGGPELRYEPPPDFYRSAIAPPDDYSANDYNASLQVYPFRPFKGDVEQAFRQGLLREWIDPRYRETNVIGQPDFRTIRIAGAERAMSARFAENVAGIPRQRMRMLVVSGAAAAIVDASANNSSTWQRALPALNAMSSTLRVQVAPAPPALAKPTGPEGQAIAGLYMGSKAKYVVNLNRPVGYGSQVTALHYYLLSADGRVYRAYDDISAPGGDIARFDFEAARRSDPGNSGRYSIRGNELRIQLGEGQSLETIVTTRPQGNRLTINTVVYIRQ